MRFEKFKFIFERASEKEVPRDYWSNIVKEIYEKTGEIPDPLEVRTRIFLEILGIPWSLEEIKKIEEKEKIIDKHLKRGVFIEKQDVILKAMKYLANKLEYSANKAGINKQGIIWGMLEYLINTAISVASFEGGFISRDFRNLYPQGLPKELKEVLDKETLEIMEEKYRHLEEIKKKYGEIKNLFKAEFPIHYFRLYGNDLFLQGYGHHPLWQDFHSQSLKKINKFAKVICIEGISSKPLGESLDLFWSHPKCQKGHLDRLMKEAVENGFPGYFAEIDPRGTLILKLREDKIKEFPEEFFEEYFNYLKKEHPNLTKYIKSPDELKNILRRCTSAKKTFYAKRVFYQAKMHWFEPYFSEKGKISFEPTFLEIDRLLFSDALAAIKLHLIAKLMADGYLPKGPIIDYRGLGHLENTSFFVENPGYAMLVVLRTLHLLKEGEITEFPQFYSIFEKPNWPEMLEKICKLVFRKPEEDPQKSVEIGPNQKKLLKKEIDFLKIYNIDPKKVLPTDEEIEGIINLAYFSSAVKKGISPK